MALPWPDLNVGEVLDYTLDYSVELGADTIATSVWTVPTGLTKTSESNTATTVTIWLRADTLGEYTVQHSATSAGGRTPKDAVSIKVVAPLGEITTVQEVKKWLKIDTSDDDDILRVTIAGASSRIIKHLKDKAAAFQDEDGAIVPELVPPEVKIATLYLVGIMYRNPDNDTDGAFEPGYLPKPVSALLYDLRVPTMA